MEEGNALQIGNFLTGFSVPSKVNKHLNPCNELFGKFTTEINKTAYRKVTPAFVSMKMAEAGLKGEQDLYTFFQECSRARNFAAFWTWSLKGKK